MGLSFSFIKYKFSFFLLIINCLIGLLVTNSTIPYALKDNMPLRRLISSQNNQVNDDVPSPLEGLPPMHVEWLHAYLETLAGLVKH